MQLLDDVDRQLAVQREDMDRQFALRSAEIEKALLEMEGAGHAYFDEMLRVGRVFDLFNTARVQEGFERQVVADTPREIEQRVGELIDWLVDADFRQWQQVTSHLAERRRQHRDRIIGDPEVATFHVERTRLIDSVGREAQRVVDSYDRRREAAALAESARNAVATAAAVGAGALGLGAVVTIVATTAAADVTGVLLAGVLGTLGLFVIPARRRKAKAELRAKITAMRETLARALREQFERELRRSSERLSESIAPYSRFVRAEQQSLTATRDELDGASGRDDDADGRVDAIGRVKGPRRGRIQSSPSVSSESTPSFTPWRAEQLRTSKMTGNEAGRRQLQKSDERRVRLVTREPAVAAPVPRSRLGRTTAEQQQHQPGEDDRASQPEPYCGTLCYRGQLAERTVQA